MIKQLVWNPDRNIFVIPYLDHPVTWYGLLFATGFVVGFFIIRKMFSELLSEGQTTEAHALVSLRLTDRLTVLVTLCCVIGARLGHVFFYDWPYYQTHKMAILKVWEGGLASHGGALGIFIALLTFFFLSRREAPRMTWMTILDAIVVPAAFAGGCIRVGNFINQEIIGTPTQLPWGVVFLQPIDGIPGVASHPVQIYEALFYFLVFLFLMILWRRKKTDLGSGVISGWFFFLVFSYRFLIEFLKMPQNETFDIRGWLSMGQLLSIPFILLGFVLLVFRYVTHLTQPIVQWKRKRTALRERKR